MQSVSELPDERDVGESSGRSDLPARPPLVFWLAVAYTTGIGARGWLAVSVEFAAALATVSGALLIASVSRRAGTRVGIVRIGLALSVFAAAGLLAGGLALRFVESGWLARTASDEPFITVGGSVASDPTVRNGTAFILLRTRCATMTDTVYTSELLQVALLGRTDPLRLGDEIEMSGRLKRIESSGPVDYRAISLRQGIAARLTTYPGQIRRLPPRGGTLGAVYAFRVASARRIDALMSTDAAAIVRGIVLGDRTLISDEVNESFKRTGTSHVLAVSGLHIVILASLLMAATSLLRLGPRVRRYLVLALVAVYSILTGCSGSVLRSAVMAAMAMFAWMLGKPREMSATIAVSAFLLLTWNPLLAYDVGFELSFGAVVALVLLGSRIEAHLAWLPEWARPGVAAAIAAQVGVAPLLVVYFNQVSIVSPFANVVVVPLGNFVLALGLVGSIIAPLAAPIGWLVLRVAGLASDLMIAATRAFGSVRPAATLVGTPSVATAAGYYAGVWWLLDRRGPPSRVPRLLPLLALAALIFAMPAGLLRAGSAPADPDPRLRITFLDVGQGDATLLRTARETILVDGGPSRSLLTKGLADEGVSKLDVLLVTHDHDDHTAGLDGLGSALSVSAVAVARGIPLRGTMGRIVSDLSRHGATVRRVREGDRLEFADRLALTVIFPDEELIRDSDSDANNNSLVVRATYGDFAMLLPGDLQEQAEQKLLREGLNLRADVVKIAHHGSSRGSTSRFLRAVAPSIAVISVGAGNSFGHPAPSTLSRLSRAGIGVRRTDRAGDIEIITDGTAQRIETER